MKSRRHIYLVASSLLVMTSNAFAQSASPPAAAIDDPLSGDIVVTAQKREQLLSDVGLTINVRTGDELRDLGISSTSDLNKMVPALSIVPSNVGLSGAPIYTLRGVGFAEHSISALSAVSVYVDEVPLSYPYMTAGPLLDISRVEVLKGPQGTLYGQNSTGGAINYIANKPTDTFSGGFDMSYGRFNRLELEGFISGPISETLKARLAIKRITADGWQKSRTRPSDRLGEVDQWSGRLLVDWDPSSNFRVRLNLNGWRDHSETLAPQVIGFNPAVGPGAFNNAYPYRNLVADALVTDDNNIRTTDWSTNVDLRNRNSMKQGSARVEWDLSDAVTLTSLSTYTDLKIFAPHDIDSSDFTFYIYTGLGRIKSFNQELRLSGELGDGLNWLIGANYSHDDISAEDIAFQPNVTIGFFANVNAANPVTESTRKAKAVFGNFDYELTPQLTLTAGARYTDVDLSYEGCTRDVDGTLAALVRSGTPVGACVTRHIVTPPIGSFGLVTTGLKEDNLSWRVGLNYKPIDGTLIYGLVSRGYKSGDIPTIVALTDVQLQPVRQEELTAFELGFKARISRQFQVNAAMFHYRYIDKQLYAQVFQPLLNSTSELTVNVPKGRINGAEIEANWEPVPGLRLRSGIGYTDSKIGKNAPPQVGIDATPIFPVPSNFLRSFTADVSGDPFNLAPKWQANGDAQYEWQIGSLTAMIGGSATHASSTLQSIGATDVVRLNTHTVFDARIGISNEAAGWHASIWGRNITGERYTVAFLRNFDVTQRFNGMPTTWGASLGYRF